jgi:hypothetical protein
MLWWWISGALGVLLYFAIFVIWGLGCVQKSRWLWFGLGFFLPILWIIGASRSETGSPQTT